MSVGQCHTVPLDQRPNISCTTIQSHLQFASLLNQACGVPKLERSCQTWKANYFLTLKMPLLSSAHRTSCPVTLEVCGVLVGSQPILASHLWDGHLPAENLSYAHQLLSHQPQAAPQGAQICHRLTWFLTTGLLLKHSVDLFPIETTPVLLCKTVHGSAILYLLLLIKTHIQIGIEVNENNN